MSYLTQLAAVARRTGYPVTEVPGWRTRGHGEQPSVQGVVCHHTGGAATGDYPSLGVVRDGRSDLAGPLSHFGLGRSGRIYVIAAGRCWHNAPSTSAHHTNSASIGIEAENTGTGQAWPAAQLDAYRLLVAEICREFGLPASRVKAHREVNTQKDDPRGINMNAFRGDVDRLIKGDDMPTVEEFWNAPIDTGDGKKPWRAKTVLGNLEADQDRTNQMLTQVLVKMDAQQATIDKLADALGSASVMTPEQVQDLKTDIRAAIDGVTVHLQTADEPDPAAT